MPQASSWDHAGLGESHEGRLLQGETLIFPVYHKPGSVGQGEEGAGG